MFNIFDEMTEQLLLDFIDGKRDEIVVSMKDFDSVMKIIDEKGIKTYSFLDADEPVIQRIEDNQNLLKDKEKRIMNVKATRAGTKVTTGKVRLSYTHLFEPHAIEGNDPKFSTSVLIPKTDKATLTAIKEAVEQVKKEGTAKWGGKVPPNLKTPLRDGDAERPDDEAYKGCYFLNANSKNKPGVVDANVQPVLDATEVYSGCYGRLTLNFYAFNAQGNKGVACGLGNVQKLEDGEPLGGFTRAEDDFTAVGSSEDDFLG